MRLCQLPWEYEDAVRDTLSAFSTGQELEKGLDSFLIAFAKPPEAVHFALLLQRSMRTLFAAGPRPIFCSIGVHVGEVLVEPGGPLKIKSVFGLPVDYCKLLLSVAGAGQILLTRFPFEHARHAFQSEGFVGPKVVKNFFSCAGEILP